MSSRPDIMQRPTLRKLLLALACAVALPRATQAHLGSPYPIMNDQPIPGYMVSVLANPDVWHASASVTFNVKPPAGPAVTGVDMWIQPESRRVKPVIYHMERESNDPVQYFVHPDSTMPRCELSASASTCPTAPRNTSSRAPSPRRRASARGACYFS